MEILSIGFALLFTALKLTGHIKWSWQLVLAPLWVPLLLVLVFGIIGGMASV